MTSPRPHRLPDLLDTAAGLLDHLGPVTGLRLGCHTSLPEDAPVRLLVKNGLPYTTEVGALDRIGVALGAPVTHQRASGITLSSVDGAWGGTPVHASHVSADHPTEDEPCTHAASRIAGRARALIPWAREEWTRWAESLHVYDRRGTPCLHVVFNSESQDEALSALLDATGPLQYRHARQHDYGVHGSVLLPDGTVVTTSAVSPT